MNLPKSIIEAYEEERARFDGYKGPLFRAVETAMKEPETAKGISEYLDRLEKSDPEALYEAMKEWR